MAFGPEEHRHHETLREDLFLRRHSCGLDVFLCTKPGFQKRYSCFATRFGSIDTSFRRAGEERVEVPDGVAHFLEHKLFEGPDGNALEAFSQLGASCNAYTSFGVTNYLFSCGTSFFKNLERLIEFVRAPYFTDDNVEKEKGIIIQEMRMYEDHPGWRGFYNLLECLYSQHPIRKQIIGTAESVGRIDREVLYACHRTFYHPQNMILFAIGDIDREAYFDRVDHFLSEREVEPWTSVERFTPEEPPEISEQIREVSMEVSMPRLLVGFKDRDVRAGGRDLLRKSLLSDITLEIVFGKASPFFERYYEDQLIDEGFAASYSGLPSVGYSVVGGETPDPEKLTSAILLELQETIERGVSPEDFERQKRAVIGHFIRSFNSLEFIANHFCSYRFWGMDLFDIVDVLHEIEPSEIEARLRQHLVEDAMARSVVLPKAAKQ